MEKTSQSVRPITNLHWPNISTSQLLPVSFRGVESHLFLVFIYYCSNLEWTFLCWSRTRLSYRENDCPDVFIIYYIIWVVKREAATAKEQNMRLERWLTAIEWSIQVSSQLWIHKPQKNGLRKLHLYICACICIHML